ncbi:hypothetical protein PS834_03137 [Pseudomonas fluorescens]|nr:hypothetical protein PS834_03137 [Pseudomonas fluorescens]
MDTGQPWVAVLSALALAAPLGFFAEEGASSTASCLIKAVLGADFSRTSGTGLATSIAPALSGTLGTVLICVAGLPSNNGLSASAWGPNPVCANGRASCSSHWRTRPDLTLPSTCAPSRTVTPMPAVTHTSNRLISTSALICPSSSFKYGGGSMRSQLTIADR